PEDEVCGLRSYLRQRSMLVAMTSHAVHHMQKALAQMHLKLTEVVSDSTGMTGMTIIRAILAGERDPQLLATYRDKRCKHDQGTIAKALTLQRHFNAMTTVGHVASRFFRRSNAGKAPQLLICERMPLSGRREGSHSGINVSSRMQSPIVWRPLWPHLTSG